VPNCLSKKPGISTEPRVMDVGMRAVVIVGDRTIATDVTTMPLAAAPIVNPYRKISLARPLKRSP
jgi:hypothetical protein